jgi:phosphoribosyl 1,2-cyclic phosphodiesterase
MRVVPLGSGSHGNSTLVEFGKTRVLVDAGMSAKQLKIHLATCGVLPEQIDCILLTHEHQDHACGAERFSMLHGVPVASTLETLHAMDRSPVHFAEWHPLTPSGWIDLGPIRVESFPVPHDAARPVGFVLHGEGLRVGLATDLGHATTLVTERLKGCHILMVESNHDETMLQLGSYPWHLKQRVSGRLGHLSNNEAASLIRNTAGPECSAVILAHLSEKNNTQALARSTAAAAMLEAGGKRAQMRVAAARRPTPAIEL